MAEKRRIDFTQGSIPKLLITFCIPIVLGELLQNFYNSADALVVGNFAGASALAAVSVCSTLSKLLTGFFNGMSVGASVVVSKTRGSRDPGRLADSMRVSFAFSAVLGILLSVAGILLTPVLVRISDVPPSVCSEAVTYLRVYLAGILFTVIYNIGAGIVRACGDSRTPFLILAFTSALNILLDLFFAAVLKMGVLGVALATVLAQMVSVILIYRALRRMEPTFGLSLDSLKEHRDIVMEVMNVGFPAGVQQSVISFSNLFVWRYISSFESASVIAGIGVAQRLDQFISLPSKAFGLALSTFTAQNLGAGNKERVRKGGGVVLLLSLTVTYGIGAALYAKAEFLGSLFNDDPAVVAVTAGMMHTIIPFYGAMALREVCSGLLRGCGRSKSTMVLVLIGMVGFRQVYLYYMMRRFRDILVIYYCYPLAWGAAAVLVSVYYLYMRKTERL